MMTQLKLFPLVERLFFAAATIVAEAPGGRRTAAMASVCCFPVLIALSGNVGAQYLYLTNDPRQTHEQLIADLRNGNVNSENLSSEAQSALQNLIRSVPALKASKPESLCQTLEVHFPSGRKLAFRTVHGNSTIDWVVDVSQSPERVLHVAGWHIAKGTNAGPPAILPPVMPGTLDKVLPAVDLDCAPMSSLRASDEDLKLACQTWPGMCQ
jgi:hypothetical protein